MYTIYIYIESSKRVTSLNVLLDGKNKRGNVSLAINICRENVVNNSIIAEFKQQVRISMLPPC